MSDAKFFNKMQFEVKFRKYWLSGNPACTLNCGEVIEGPYDILSTMPFLQHIPLNFSEVDSITFGNNYIPKVDDSISEKYSNKKVEYTKIESNTNIVDASEQIESSPQEESTATEFDPSNVNWLQIKVSQLETICKINNIDISKLEGLKPKDKKWELVKLVKSHYKI